MASVHRQATLDSIAKLMDNQKYSELIIECQDHRWHVEKAIFCSMSEIIAATCATPMQEGTSGIIKHDEYDAATMDRMIQYIYKQTYSVEGEDDLVGSHKLDSTETEAVKSPSDIDINSIFLTHVQVYGIGDYYRIPTLKLYAIERFAAVAKCGLQTDGFIDVVRAVNKRCPTDRALRDPLRVYAITHRIELTKDEEFMRELAEMDDVQDFAVDMFRQMVCQQILDKDADEQQLQLRDDQISGRDHKITALEAANQRASAAADARVETAQEMREHVEAVMENLITDLSDLPETCRNARCDREFGSGNLSFERKGH